VNPERNILLVIPTAAGVHPRTSAVAALFSQRSDTTYITLCGQPHDYVRNAAVRCFLDQGQYSHLFFLDSDIEPPLDTIDRLLALDSPLASGCYGQLLPAGPRWVLSVRGDDDRYRMIESLPGSEKPFEIDAAGAGCLLIRRDVLEKIPWPWFRWVEKPDGRQISEDIFFFYQCNRAGLRVRIDPQVICNHYKQVNITTLLRPRRQE